MLCGWSIVRCMDTSMITRSRMKFTTRTKGLGARQGHVGQGATGLSVAGAASAAHTRPVQDIDSPPSSAGTSAHIGALRCYDPEKPPPTAHMRTAQDHLDGPWLTHTRHVPHVHVPRSHHHLRAHACRLAAATMGAGAWNGRMRRCSRAHWAAGACLTMNGCWSTCSSVMRSAGIFCSSPAMRLLASSEMAAPSSG